MAEAPKKKIANDEIQQMFDKFHNMKNDLVKKMEELYQKAGVSDKQIQQFLDNPQNFNDRQWKKLQQQREEQKRKIEELVGKEGMKDTETKAKKKEGDARARKTLGSRKKNWIPMR